MKIRRLRGIRRSTPTPPLLHRILPIPPRVDVERRQRSVGAAGVKGRPPTDPQRPRRHKIRLVSTAGTPTGERTSTTCPRACESGACACEFNDLQDLLGFDRPSKAFTWLIKAAIDELPWLDPAAFVACRTARSRLGLVPASSSLLTANSPSRRPAGVPGSHPMWFLGMQVVRVSVPPPASILLWRVLQVA